MVAKTYLIREMGSTNNEVALRAIDELRARGWLSDGSAARANLSGANLQGANLQRAELPGTQLENALLRNANLQNAGLENANLEGAILYAANLQGANLQGANLERAYLHRSHLTGTDLRNARFDTSTILPDNTRWTPGDDLARFTSASDGNDQQPEIASQELSSQLNLENMTLAERQSLQRLLVRWETLANEAQQKGNQQHERYYHGMAFGLRTARNELANILAEAIRSIASAGKLTK